jgi:uncharacterized protein YegL
MKQNHPMKHTEIAFILDRSGSMESMTNAAISGFNEFLKAQQATVDDHGQPIPATFTLILFDHEYLPVHNRQNIQTARPLTLDTYVPRGNTALLDAIGRTIDHIGQELAATPEADRPAKVIIAILTDGEENSSRHFSMEDINQRITHQTEKYQWEFMFLGANQDAIGHPRPSCRDLRRQCGRPPRQQRRLRQENLRLTQSQHDVQSQRAGIRHPQGIHGRNPR